METIVECGEFWYWATLGPSPPFSPFFVTLRHKQLQCSHCLHQMKTDTREDTAPPTQTEASDRHLSPQQTMHTDHNQSRSHFLKPRAKLLITLSDTKTNHSSYTLTPYQLIHLTPSNQDISTHTGVNKRQLMKTRHCWQHHQHTQSPVRPSTVSLPHMEFSFSLSLFLLFLPLIFLLLASLFSFLFFFFL